MTKLMSVAVAAQLLSISPWTVRRYIFDGKLRPVRLGRRVLLQEEDLQKFIADAKARSRNPGRQEFQESVRQSEGSGSRTELQNV